MRLPARLYQQFDADPSRPAPAEAFGGWCARDIELAPTHTALVVMHAWNANAPGDFPGWDRAVEYRPRARHILAEVFPPLLAAVRRSPLRLFHVVGGGDYYRHLPGYQRTLALPGASNETPPQLVARDPAHNHLRALRRAHGSPGTHNEPDIAAGFAQLDFAAEARPQADEGIAENGAQLAALCRHHGVNHLIYVGFAINWCLLMSPGGMVDMARHGCLCSTIADAVTAVENRETAAREFEKQQALWRIAIEFGFVFSLADFLSALPRRSAPSS